VAADNALHLLNALAVAEDGARWGERATEVQRRDAEALLDRAGPRRHWISRSRGYSKTDDLACVTVAVLLEQLRAGDEAIGVAADRDQARILIDRIRRIAERTPELAGALDVQTYAVTTRAGVRFEAMPADAASSWGRSPAWTVADELCQWNETPNARTVWESVSTAAVKVRGRVAIITTSGDPGHWSRGVYEHALTDVGWRVSETHGPAPWLDAAEVESERRRLPESAYLRLFENRWCATEDKLLPYEDVAACAVLPGRLDPQPRMQYVMGVDLAIRRDRTAVAVAHAEPVEGLGGAVRIVVDSLDVFEASRRRDIDLSAVEGCVEARSRQYNDAAVIFDPAQAHQMMQRLRGAGVRVIEHAFTAASNSRRALALLELVRARRLALPDEQDVVQEFAALRLVERGPGLYRYDHDSGKHDDRVTAIGLAAQHLLERQSVNLTAFANSDATFFAGPPVPSRWAVQDIDGVPESTDRRQITPTGIGGAAIVRGNREATQDELSWFRF
jgi:hypothetical protein